MKVLYIYKSSQVRPSRVPCKYWRSRAISEIQSQLSLSSDYSLELGNLRSNFVLFKGYKYTFQYLQMLLPLQLYNCRSTGSTLLILILFVVPKYAFFAIQTAIFLSKCKNTNFNSTSSGVPEIKSLYRQTDKQRSHLIRFPFFLKSYGILIITMPTLVFSNNT